MCLSPCRVTIFGNTITMKVHCKALEHVKQLEWILVISNTGNSKHNILTHTLERRLVCLITFSPGSCGANSRCFIGV